MKKKAIIFVGFLLLSGLLFSTYNLLKPDSFGAWKFNPFTNKLDYYVTSSSVGNGWATTTNDLILYPADTDHVVVIGDDATTTTGNMFEVVGNMKSTNLTTATATADTICLSGDSCVTEWSAGGTVTSVDMSVPTGLSISGNPVTTSGTLALTFAGGYEIPKTASTTEWATAYGWGNWATQGLITQSYASSTYQPLGVYATQAYASSTYQLLGIYATQAYASSTYALLSSNYLTQAFASSTYQPLGIYATQAYASSTYALLSSIYLTQALASSSFSLLTHNHNTLYDVLGQATSTLASHTTTYNHANYDTSYTDRLKWDGGSTGLTAETGRQSLGLGNIALQNASLLTVYIASTTNLTATGTAYLANTIISGTLSFTGLGNIQLLNGSSGYTNNAGNVFLDSTSGQLRFNDSTATRTVPSLLCASYPYSTSTPWSGTTTKYLGPAGAGETWENAYCETDTGTVNVSVYDGTNRMNLINASTTINKFTFSTNNVFTQGESRRIDFGTPASSPTSCACTFCKRITAD